MFTVKGEHYFNDFNRNDFTKSFDTLDDIFNWMAEVSENFNGAYGNYFPRVTETYVGRISAKDEHNRGYEY